MARGAKSNTCLAVLRDKRGKLWFAGDRRVSWGMHRAQKSPRSKIAYRNGVLLAGCGLSALCDEIVELMEIPVYNKKETVFHYIHNSFMPHLFDHLHMKKFLHENERRLAYKENKPPEPNVDDDIGASFLIGLKGEVFELDVDNHLISIDAVDVPTALGCGGPLALGSLLTTQGSKLSEEVRLKKALQVAASVSPGCDAFADILVEE